MLLTIMTEGTKRGIVGLVLDVNEVVVDRTAAYDDWRDAYGAARMKRDALINAAKAGFEMEAA